MLKSPWRTFFLHRFPPQRKRTGRGGEGSSRGIGGGRLQRLACHQPVLAWRCGALPPLCKPWQTSSKREVGRPQPGAASREAPALHPQEARLFRRRDDEANRSRGDSGAAAADSRGPGRDIFFIESGRDRDGRALYRRRVRRVLGEQARDIGACTKLRSRQRRPGPLTNPAGVYAHKPGIQRTFWSETLAPDPPEMRAEHCHMPVPLSRAKWNKPKRRLY